MRLGIFGLRKRYCPIKRAMLFDAEGEAKAIEEIEKELEAEETEKEVPVEAFEKQ